MTIQSIFNAESSIQSTGMSRTRARRSEAAAAEEEIALAGPNKPDQGSIKSEISSIPEHGIHPQD